MGGECKTPGQAGKDALQEHRANNPLIVGQQEFVNAVGANSVATKYSDGSVGYSGNTIAPRIAATADGLLGALKAAGAMASAAVTCDASAGYSGKQNVGHDQAAVRGNTKGGPG